MRTKFWWLAAGALLALGACDSPMTPDGGASDAGEMTDAGETQGDAGDACMGLDLCTRAGSTCSGDSVVTCAQNADGCLVEMETACGAEQVCDDSGETAMCVDVDPCEAIPADDLCETDGERVCNGDTLEECGMDENGCLVLTRTECGAEEGGLCDSSGAMPMCIAPPDPCEAIAADERCTAAGTSCDGTSLVTCAPNAFGCLVKTTDDCAARAGGTCEGTPAACVFTGDPCEGITQCAAEGVSCDGPELVECAPDAYGCLVETRTTCTDEMFGFCDAEAAVPMCSTAATDPCMGETECGTEVTRACSADSTAIETCSPNAFGCFVAGATACEGGDVCSDADGAAICVDPCSLVTTCPSDTYCDGDDVVSCAPDANGCLVESSRSSCGDTCDPAGAVCVDTACPEAAPGFINCRSGTVNGDTAMGTSFNTGNYGSCYEGTSYEGNEQYWRFRNDDPMRMEVTVVATRAATSGDYDLFVLDAGDGTAACSAMTQTCSDGSRGTGAIETVTFVAEPGANAYVAYDLWSSDDATTAYTLAVTCTPVVCGDGAITADEECEDGNTTPGDGCSAICMAEVGWDCGGGTCTFVCGDGVIDSDADEVCDDGNTTPGDGCSGTCQAETDYFCSGEPSVCEPLVCGDGNVVGPEECDDTNTTAGDGCSDVCEVEEGYLCTGEGAGSCVEVTHDECAGARPVTETITYTDEPLSLGGARPSGSGCGPGTGSTTLYYEVTIPPSTKVVANAEVGPDLVVFVQNACSDADCTQSVDDPENVLLTNPGPTAITQIVGIRPYGSATSSYDVSFTYSALAANGTCGGASALTGALTGEDLTSGGTPPSGDGCGSSDGPVLYYSVNVPANSVVSVTGTPTGAAWDLTLRELEDCSGACTASRDSESSGDAETLEFTNLTGADVSRLVAVGADSTSTFGTFDLSMTTTAITYASNATCATATPLVSGTPLVGEDTAGGGASPTGTICDSSGAQTLYYEVTVPAGQAGTVEVDGATDFDAVLMVVDACGAADCTSNVDGPGNGGVETLTIDNTGGTADLTRIVAVNEYVAGDTGAFDIEVTYTTPDPGTVCGAAIPVTAAATYTGVMTGDGGAPPSGSMCRSGGSDVFYYAVTIPSGQRASVTVSSGTGFDGVINLLDSCGATDCAIDFVDGGADAVTETLDLDNTSTAPITRIVAVGDWWSNGGTFDVEFSFAPSPAP